MVSGGLQSMLEESGDDPHSKNGTTPSRLKKKRVSPYRMSSVIKLEYDLSNPVYPLVKHLILKYILGWIKPERGDPKAAPSPSPSLSQWPLFVPCGAELMRDMWFTSRDNVNLLLEVCQQGFQMSMDDQREVDTLKKLTELYSTWVQFFEKPVYATPMRNSGESTAQITTTGGWRCHLETLTIPAETPTATPGSLILPWEQLSGYKGYTPADVCAGTQPFLRMVIAHTSQVFFSEAEDGLSSQVTDELELKHQIHVAIFPQEAIYYFGTPHALHNVLQQYQELQAQILDEFEYTDLQKEKDVLKESDMINNYNNKSGTQSPANSETDNLKKTPSSHSSFSEPCLISWDAEIKYGGDFASLSDFIKSCPEMLTQQDAQGRTICHALVSVQGRLASAKYLLDLLSHDSLRDCMACKDSFGNTPLHCIVEAQNSNTIRSVLRHIPAIAEVIRNRDNSTPLDLALRRNFGNQHSVDLTSLQTHTDTETALLEEAVEKNRLLFMTFQKVAGWGHNDTHQDTAGRDIADQDMKTTSGSSRALSRVSSCSSIITELQLLTSLKVRVMFTFNLTCHAMAQ